VRGIDRGHAAGGDPAVDGGAFGTEPDLEVAIKARRETGRAMEDFIGEDLGGMGTTPGVFDLAGNIG
jgi:hypothetical protein